MTLLVVYEASCSSLGLDVGCRKQTRRWSEISILDINVLKLVFTNEFIRIWSIIVEVFLVTLVSFFTVGIRLFW